MEKKPPIKKYEQDEAGDIFEILLYEDGRKEERKLTKEELAGYNIAPAPSPLQKQEVEEQLSKPDESYMSPDEQMSMLQHYARSGLSTLFSTAIGAAAAPFAKPLIGAGALGYGYKMTTDPKGAIDLARSVGTEILKPYLSPVQSYKEDPFGTVASYVPGLALARGIGRPFTKQLAEKFATRFGSTPAAEQPVADVLGAGVKNMEAPIQLMKDMGINLNVAQAANNPIAAATLMVRPEIQPQIISQNEVVIKNVNKILDKIVGAEHRGWFKVSDELGEVADTLRFFATNRYEDIMKELKTIKGGIFAKYSKMATPVEITLTDVMGKPVKKVINSPAELRSSLKVAANLSKDDLAYLDPTSFGGTLEKEVSKAITEINNILNNPVADDAAKIVVDIKALEHYKGYLDRRISRLPSNNPSREKLMALRNGINTDIKLNMKKMGLASEYEEYNALAHKWLATFDKTEVGQALPIKSVYDETESPTKIIGKVFADSSMFDDLVKIVGPEKATVGLVQQLFRASVDSAGGINANRLIKLISQHKSKLKYLDPQLKTRLFTFAYGLQAQNRMKLAGQSALQMKEANAFIKFIGATVFGRTGIQIGTATQAAGFMLSKSDLAKILLDPQAAWTAAKLAQTSITSPNYAPRMRTFLQALSRLGIYAKSGDTIIKFARNGVPEPVTDIN